MLEEMKSKKTFEDSSLFSHRPDEEEKRKIWKQRDKNTHECFY